MSTPPLTLPDRFATDARFAAIVDELTRRGFLAGGIGTVGALSLAACGSRGKPQALPSAAPPATRVIKTAHGSVTVPAHPKRVVCVDTQSVADLFDVGYDPVGVLDGLANHPDHDTGDDE